MTSDRLSAIILSMNGAYVDKKDEKSLKNQIQELILEGIFSGEFLPQQILTEKELTARYQCSKSPVREALVSLCSEGVLRSIPRCGYQVVQLSKEDIDEILRYRLVLETGFLKSCYHSLTTAQMAKLEELNSLCNHDSDTVKQHWINNSNFHLFLISCSGNRFAYAELQRAMSILYRAYAQHYWLTWNDHTRVDDVKCHKEIISCIRNGNVAFLEDVFKRDLEDFAKYLSAKPLL